MKMTAENIETLARTRNTTFYNKMIGLMMERGLSEEPAKEVLLAYSKKDDTMQDRWDDSVSGYPDMMVAALWIGVKAVALEWIILNKPQAFYRSLFE